MEGIRYYTQSANNSDWILARFFCSTCLSSWHYSTKCDYFGLKIGVIL
uniref:Uncharacterized protein n=1 Tax=Arundo donax TaxID=35708 RepID=A0A0A9EL77_ARUDO